MEKLFKDFIIIINNMTTAIVIDKKGSIKEITIKTFDESELYKKAGFKTNDGFSCATEWGIEIKDKKYTICLYGKTDGRAGQENKYEFPPPVDNTLFFGSCVLVNHNYQDNTKIDSLTKEEWKMIYEALYGGFEDVGSEDSDESEDEEDLTLPRTKSGYVKDDFIVDDDIVESEIESEDDNYESEDEELPVITQKKIAKVSKKKPVKIAKNKKKTTVFDIIETSTADDPTTFLDCTSELVEEEYV